MTNYKIACLIKDECIIQNGNCEDWGVYKFCHLVNPNGTRLYHINDITNSLNQKEYFKDEE